MKIKKITLFTNQISAQLSFYKNTLGFSIIEESDQHFSVQVGWTKMTFQLSKEAYKYHYCFLIPSNKLKESITWLSKKLDIIKIEEERIIQHFLSWNARSIYFFDAAGNLAEFIVRYDLKNESDTNDFDLSQILCLNEIGMTSKNVKKINDVLEEKMNSKLWKGDLTRFGVNGTQEGLFLLVNYELKEYWFPTKLKPLSCPFHGIFESQGQLYPIEFINEEVKINL